MSNISDKILEVIRKNHISPKPRWEFVFKNWLVWLAALVLTVVGSLTFSVLLYRLVNNDWEVAKVLHRSLTWHIFLTLPYLWIFLLVLFIILAYYDTRQIKGAYKYRAYWFIVGSLAVSIILGSLLYSFGLGFSIHQFVRSRVPFTKLLMHNRESMWQQPEKGLLAGQVARILDKTGEFELVDFKNNHWIVLPVSGFRGPIGNFQLFPGQKVRLLGKLVGRGRFQAYRIMPYYIGPKYKGAPNKLRLRGRELPGAGLEKEKGI